jgi:hypothetical protein
MKLSHRIGIAASAVTLAAGVAAASAGPAAADSATRPSITSVVFDGYGGNGQSSPYVILYGSGFGASAPAGSSDNTNSCGTYTADGNVYGNQLYFLDDNNFEAGYSDSNGDDCVGVSVYSWSDSEVILYFGNAYASYQHWYLSNGDGFAVSVKGGIFGGTVSGLS